MFFIVSLLLLSTSGYKGSKRSNYFLFTLHCNSCLSFDINGMINPVDKSMPTAYEASFEH